MGNKMKGHESPKKYVNKVRMVLTQEVNIGPKIKQTTSTKINNSALILWMAKLCSIINLHCTIQDVHNYGKYIIPVVWINKFV